MHSANGNGHELDIVRAGQSVAFECNAAGQPRPRVRWYRLGSPGGAKMHNGRLPATTPTKLSGSPAGATHVDQFKLDEAQIRSALLQMDSPSALGDSFHRIELANFSKCAQTVSAWRVCG